MIGWQVEPEGLFFVFVVPPDPDKDRRTGILRLYNNILICHTTEAAEKERERYSAMGIETYCVTIALTGLEISIESLNPDEYALLIELIRTRKQHALFQLMIKAIFAERALRQWIMDGKPSKT